MATVGQQPATLDDLYRTPEKAELIRGRVVYLMPAGHNHNRAAYRIMRSLDDHAEQTGVGCAYTDGMGFAVPRLPSGRQSFAPDVAYHAGPLPTNLERFVEGPPTFAVEVRSENECTPSAEAEQAEKRDDYFAAGTLVVWDVDPRAQTVTVYRPSAPTRPIVFHRGSVADAEPAVPGWRLPVHEIFA